MAKRKSASKIQPAVDTLKFQTPALGDPGSYTYNGGFYIDLAKAASEINRRAYRQGRQWMVAGFTFVSVGTGTISVSKLPVTWVVSNSWEKTFRAWDKQQMEAIKQAGAQSTVSKFRDFKIAMDDTHFGLKGTDYELVPSDAGGNAALTGEWDWSEITIPGSSGGASADVGLHMLGADGLNSRSLVLGYERSRAYPEASTPEEQNPNTSFLSEMFDVGASNDNIIANATDRNDDAPYDRSNYPGNDTNTPDPHIHGYANIVQYSAGAGQTVDTAHMNGGCFPCGLMRVQWTEATNSQPLVVLVHMVPGNYRGYLAPPMTEM